MQNVLLKLQPTNEERDWSSYSMNEGCSFEIRHEERRDQYNQEEEEYNLLVQTQVQLLITHCLLMIKEAKERMMDLRMMHTQPPSTSNKGSILQCTCTL